ncbi:hypothetical protein BX666DRAFT_2023914 [Dichotomocladium elegans]|nr:hypothetical protein BX666DRAFT_2023914 [Dichotomocladium elegans]
MSEKPAIESKSEKRRLEGIDTDNQAKCHRPGHTGAESSRTQNDNRHATAAQLSLDKAKQNARELAAKIATPIPPALMSLNPHIASGVDVRTLSVLSRIYVGSINFELNESHVRAVFRQFGPIKSVSMSVDPSTMRHKGFCFIEYEAPEAAQMAVDTMHGVDLGGRQLKVGRPNNYAAAAAVPVPTPPRSRIYVANVNDLITEENIRNIFEAFGPIKHCIMMPDLLTRKHKEYGFIEFEQDESAEAAIRSMNNFEIGGKNLRVARCIVGGPIGEGMASLDKIPKSSTPISYPGDVLSKVNANIINLGLQKKFEPPTMVKTLSSTDPSAATRAAIAQIAKEQAVRAQAMDSVAKEEDINVSSSQRFAIMQKLAASREELSTFLLVRNAVALSDVDESLREDFMEECSKFGKVNKVIIRTSKLDSTDYKVPESGWKPGDGDVKIFVEFDSAESR